MNESIQLLSGIVPGSLRPGWVSLGVPIHNEAVIVGGSPEGYGRGRLCVRLEGLPVSRAEVWRQDDPTLLGSSSKPLQVEIIKKEEALKEWPIFAQPIGSLVFRNLEENIWMAEAPDMKVLEEGGLDWFAGVLMEFVQRKQERPDFQRPVSAQPEL